MKRGILKTLILATTLVVSFIFKITYNQAYGATRGQTQCKLPKGETLNIGCTTKCGWFNTTAIKSAASELDYKVKLINMYEQKDNVNKQELDAIIIPGGADIDPKYYVDTIQNNDIKSETKRLNKFVKYSKEGKQRDPFEFAILKKHFNENSKTPILGICRGMQVLTVSQGIPLYVDIKEQLDIDNPMYTIDTVEVTNADSLISGIMKKNEFWGVQLHHQALRLDYFNKNKDKWPHLNISAVSNEGKIAEVLEFKNKPILGVQFHPEYTLGKVRNRIFTWLLTKACEKKYN